jgi:TRAP-type C4-dicarboxylate transport system permease small subunit
MKRALAFLSSLYDGLLVVLNYISVVLIFLTAIWIFGDVVGRFIFNQPIPGTTELVKTAILPIVFLGVTYTLRKDGHIRTTVLVRRLPVRVAALFTAIGSLLGMALFTLMAYYGWEEAVKSWAVREFEGIQLRVPTYPSRFVMVLGSALLTVQFGILFVQAVIRMIDSRSGLSQGANS